MSNSNKQKYKEGKKDEKSKKEEIDEVRAQLARALADYDNLRKRIEKERSDYERVVKTRIISRFLEVFDMLNEVQNNLEDTGLAIAMNTFRDVLKEEGVEEIKVEPGMKFDEELHEAVEVVSDENKENGEIVDLHQAGWWFKDGQILRYAKVIVNRGGKK